MVDWYVLDENNRPVLVSTSAEHFAVHPSKNIVEQTNTKYGYVSTVFLGLDHKFIGVGPPVVFETLISGGDRDKDITRYTTWADAKRGHDLIVNEINGEAMLPLDFFDKEQG